MKVLRANLESVDRENNYKFEELSCRALNRYALENAGTLINDDFILHNNPRSCICDVYSARSRIYIELNPSINWHRFQERGVSKRSASDCEVLIADTNKHWRKKMENVQDTLYVYEQEIFAKDQAIKAYQSMATNQNAMLTKQVTV